MAFAENTVGLGSAGIGRRVGDLRPNRPPFSRGEVITVHAAFRKYPWLINLILILLTTYVITSLFFSGPSAPVEVISGEISPLVVKMGDPLQVKFIVNRSQICENTIYSYWENEVNDPTPITLPMRTRTIDKTGKNLPVYLTLAAPMQVGQQCYQSRIVHHCPGGDRTTDTPTLCVQVTP